MSLEVATHKCDCGQSYKSAEALNAHQLYCPAAHDDPHRCNMCGNVYDMTHWEACPSCDPEVDV